MDINLLPLNEAATQNRQNMMFRHVVNRVREIGLTCLAEGAEIRGQLDIIRKNGCDIAQEIL